MSYIAMLGMYDQAIVQPANDAFWSAIRAQIGFGPTHLSRDLDFWAMWRSPDLLLGQTCGYPYRAELHEIVQKVVTPDYGLPDCPAGHYRSVFIVRDTDPAQSIADCHGKRFAFNEDLSQSGWAGPQHEMRVQGVQGSHLIRTGAHARSILAVTSGQADFAAIDQHSWDLLQQDGNSTQGLRILHATPPTPGLPFITSATQDAKALRTGILNAHAALADDTRKTLGIRAFVDVPLADYLAAPTPPSPEQTGLPIHHLGSTEA